MKKQVCSILLSVIIAPCYLLKASSIIDGPQNTTVQEGHSAAFSCIISDSTALPFWYIDGQYYSVISLPPKHFFNISQQQLTFRNVSLSDDGATYQCGLFPQLLSDVATLTVIESIDMTTTLLITTSKFSTAAIPTVATDTTALNASISTNTFEQAVSTAASASNASVTTMQAPDRGSKVRLIAVITTTCACALLLFTLSLACCYWEKRKRKSLSIHITHRGADTNTASNNYAIIDLQAQQQINEDTSSDSHFEQFEESNVCAPIYDVIFNSGPQNNAHESQENVGNASTMDNKSIANHDSITAFEAPRRKRATIQMYDAVTTEHINTSESTDDDSTYSSLQHRFSTRFTQHNVGRHRSIGKASTATELKKAQYSNLNTIAIQGDGHENNTIPFSSTNSLATYSSLKMQPTTLLQYDGVLTSTSDLPHIATHQESASVNGDSIIQDKHCAMPLYSAVNKAKKNTNYSIITAADLIESGTCDNEDTSSVRIDPAKSTCYTADSLPNSKEQTALRHDVTDVTDNSRINSEFSQLTI